MSRPLALLIDDDPDFLASLEMLVRREGFGTCLARSLAEAEERLAEVSPDVVLVDLELPDGNGWAMVRGHEVREHAEVIVITGNASVESAVGALHEGALDYLTKPCDRARLTSCLGHVARTRLLKGEIDELRTDLRELGRFGEMVGRSPAMQAMYDLLGKVSATDLCVLVEGESGVGKELVARTIHRLSPRRDGPLLPVNCGAVASALVESELFGHERGSFTGADREHAGYFERCRGGTLFLDEITEMPLDLQVRLLRVLESREVLRVGGRDPIAVDVRVVAATNRDPAAAMKDGRLREDLYYRLAVLPVRVPPLREREGDVPLLAQHFLEELDRLHGTSKRWDPAALDALERQPFPGNVRELRNLVSRAHVLSSDVLGVGSVGSGSPAAAMGAPVAEGRLGVEVGSTIADVERQLIEATLASLGGDKQRTADMLGISVKTLYNRLKLYAAEAGATSR